MPDLRRSDVALGVAVAALVMGGSATAVVASPGRATSEPVLIGPDEVAVAVRPVAVRPPTAPPDTPSRPASDDADPATTAYRVPTGAPSGQPPAPSAVPVRPDDAPPPSSGPRPPRPRGGIRPLPRLAGPSAPPLHDVAGDDLPTPGFGPGGPGVAPGPADPADSPDDPYAYVDPELETPGVTVADGIVGGEPDAADADAVDPLATRALASYRQRLQRWLSVHFTVTGTGLTLEELKRQPVRAVVVIDDERRVVDFEVSDQGHPALLAAAHRALDAVMGRLLPTPPRHYPGPLQRRIAVTFVCTEDRCS